MSPLVRTDSADLHSADSGAETGYPGVTPLTRQDSAPMHLLRYALFAFCTEASQLGQVVVRKELTEKKEREKKRCDATAASEEP